MSYYMVHGMTGGNPRAGAQVAGFLAVALTPVVAIGAVGFIQHKAAADADKLQPCPTHYFNNDLFFEKAASGECVVKDPKVVDEGAKSSFVSANLNGEPVTFQMDTDYLKKFLELGVG